MPPTVTVHYPFHPLVHHQLQVIRWPRLNSGATTVLQPEAAQLKRQSQIGLSRIALLSLVDLLASASSSKVNPGKQSERTSEASSNALPERGGQSSGNTIDE